MKKFDEKAAQNFFPEDDNENLKLEVKCNKDNKISGVSFVFNNTTNGKWFNNNRQDYRIKFTNLSNLIKKKINLSQGDNELNEEELHEAEIPEFIRDVINCEVNYGSWTLMHRYNKCFDILNSIDINDSHNLVYIFLWLRYSYTKQLSWQRNYNTKPRELAHSMNRLTESITGKICYLLNEGSGNFFNSIKNKTLADQEYGEITSFELTSLHLLRNSLSMLGKGNGDGQKIRDEILVILHRHHIKETNDHFYEQWHQKLHNNTTPDDIDICQAVINYLKSGGNINIYWETLNKANITKERLANFERKITSEPYFNPNLIHDFENFLHILKSVHSSGDLIMMFNSAKNYLGNDYNIFEEIIKNNEHWDSIKQMSRITNGREKLNGLILRNKDRNILRDLLFLDFALENQMRKLVEKIIHINLQFENYVDEVNFILRNILINYGGYKELKLASNDWFNIVNPLKFIFNENNNNKRENVLKIKSISDRLLRCLSHIIDFFNSYVDKKSKFLGREFQADEFIVSLFTEEIIRGSIFFTLSMVLKKLDPFLRKAADLGNWKIISPAPKNKKILYGNFDYVKNLKDVQFKTYPKNTILLAEYVGGNEEVPINVDCLIIMNNDYPDTLAHVSVRVRNMGIPLIVCFEEDIHKEIRKNVGKFGYIKFLGGENVNFGTDNDNKNIVRNDKNTNGNINNGNGNDNSDSETSRGNNNEENEGKIIVDKKGDYEDILNKTQKIILELSEFNKNLMGAKANNTKRVSGNLPNWVQYPQSFGIPFNVMEYFLSLEENKEISNKIKKELDLIKLNNNNNCNNKNKINKINIAEKLNLCQKFLLQMKFVENELTKEIRNRIISFGVPIEEFDNAWLTLKKLWASKFNQRVFISTSKIGVDLEEIKMAVLVQKVCEADYAFVVHTKDPVTNDPNVLYGEIVLGLGETLVGTFEGQSFSFNYNKDSKIFKILSFPNKSISLKNSGYIFRSDSNTEDLQGFAGAGLFDSIILNENKALHNEYSKSEIFNNEKFRTDLINNITKLSLEVEKIYNYPQDIEGCYVDGIYYIVQTRPQV